ncbi:Tetratricopeptide TPR_1 repeat-containing protein [[Leptolyngbya] sp. PCC 7376]|uniref:CHAT domain-containing protein n=1 Tax=[Leptolyngbya] sp. PCC 7376 TaxID=111781 RepID=UPI00029EF6A0|nr:CHAT domain-containing tetratricopeptide repeat protein [[Leptolyngbya] sp. PCC 7376]AFY38783.1 Tetratricopeptide TPR_1 repeat-containing protein [[Leptolyngbya] sp. PCC 7376]
MFGWLFGRKKKQQETPSFDLGQLAQQQQEIERQLATRQQQTVTADTQPQDKDINSSPNTKQNSAEQIPEPKDSNDAEAWFNQGYQFHIAGRFIEAIASYDKALEINPNDQDIWNNRGSALSTLGKKDEAITSYDKALEINPDDQDTWNNRGSTLSDLGRKEEAITSYDKSLEINPNHYQAWRNRGSALSDLGRKEEAIISFDKALEINPNYHEAWGARGNALLACERYEEAITSFDKAFDISPNYDETPYGRGYALEKLGKHEEAIISFDKALEINPNHYQAWNGKGRALVELAQFSEGIDSYNKSLEIMPSSWPTWGNKGSALYLIHGEKAAILNWQTGLISLDIHAPDYAIGAGTLHQSIGKVHYYTARQLVRTIDAKDRYHQSIEAYHLALDSLCGGEHPFRPERLNPSIETPALPSANKELCLNVLQDLSQSYVGAGQTENAATVRTIAIELLETYLREISSETQKITIARKFASLYQLEIDQLARSTEPADHITALTRAEYRKTLTLHWLHNNRYEDISSPSFDDISDFLHQNQPDTALIFWHLSPVQLSTFILHPDDSAGGLKLLRPQICDLTAVTQLEALLKKWHDEYQESRKSKIQRHEVPPDWQKHLPDRLTELRQILQLDQWLPALRDCKNLILVPHRDLHLLPLHTCIIQAWPGETLPSITHLPSIKQGILNQQHHHTSPTFTNRLLLEASGDYGLYSELEAAILKQLLTPQTSLSEPTKSQTLNALSQPQNLVHFTGHGEYNLSQNSRSGLVLYDGERLTLSELLQTELPVYSLVSLSACETAVTGSASLIDEFVGFSAAFLYHRTRYILSTLWTVPENSAAIMMIEFYRRLLSNADVTPATALQQTQTWLAAATNTDLADWYENWATEFDGHWEDDKFTIILRRRITKLREQPDKIQYSNPYHWAGFTITGC